MDGYWTLDRYPDHFGPAERDRLKEVLREAPKGKDVVLFEGTSLTWHPKPDSLDAAWAEAEQAAEAKGWRIAITPFYPEGYEAYAYDLTLWPSDVSGRSRAHFGETAIEALRALIVELRA
jgi:hypothetical protein